MADILALKFEYFRKSLYEALLLKEINIVFKWPWPSGLIKGFPKLTQNLILLCITNISCYILGNYTFFAESSPLLFDVIHKAASTVKCSDPDYQDMSVLERWNQTYRDPENPFQPK